MRITRPWRWVLGVSAAIVVLFGAYAGWLGFQVYGHLNTAATAASAAKTSLTSGDAAGAKAEFAEFASSAEAASDATANPVWKVIEWMPFLGDDAEGIRVISQIGSDIGGGSLNALVPRIDDLERLAPQDGKIDVALISGLAGPVEAAATELSAANQELQAIDPSGYIGRLKVEFRDLRGQVSQASKALNVASDVTKVAPELLGANGPRKYHLVVQNNAEARATGGLLGAVSVLETNDGRIEMTRQVAGSAIPWSETPVLPLTNAELNLYGEIVGTFFVNANMQPDWGRASDLMAAHWKRNFNEEIDGVFSLDPVVLSYLLKATGSVTVDSVELTSENAVEYLLHKVYLEYADPAAQDLFFRQVAQEIFERMILQGVDLRQLVDALAQGSSEGRILIHAFAREVEAVLDDTQVGGRVLGLTEDPAWVPSKSPEIGIYINEGTSSKMSYFMETDVRIVPTTCSNGTQTYTAKLSIANTMDPAKLAKYPSYISGHEDGAVPGRISPVIDVYGPIDGRLDEPVVAGVRAPYTVEADDYRRPLRQVWVDVMPGETVDIEWRLTGGQGHNLSTHVDANPDIQSGTNSAVLKSAC